MGAVSPDQPKDTGCDEAGVPLSRAFVSFSVGGADLARSVTYVRVLRVGFSMVVYVFGVCFVYRVPGGKRSDCLGTQRDLRARSRESFKRHRRATAISRSAIGRTYPVPC